MLHSILLSLLLLLHLGMMTSWIGQTWRRRIATPSIVSQPFPSHRTLSNSAYRHRRTSARYATPSYRNKRDKESSSGFSYKDLPDETLYIIDGTAMMFKAHFSRENKENWRDAYLNPEISAQIIEQWDLLAPPVPADNNDDSKGKGASTNSDEDLEEEDDEIDEDGMIKPILYLDGGFGEPTTPVVHCGALTAMMLNFARLVRDVQPRYLAVAFDVSRHTFRNDLYPAYKQHRSAVPPYLIPLLGMAPSLMEKLGCRCYMQQGYEADDVMATLSRWARDRGLNVVHVSADKDMLQLVDTGVHVMDPWSREIFGPDEVRVWTD